MTSRNRAVGETIAGPPGHSGTYLLASAIVVTLAVLLFVDPIPQDPAYHRFADARTLLGIPNFWNVASNLAFVIAGSWGMGRVARRKVAPPALRPAYLVFYFGIFATAFGSGFYHYAPGNESLMLDRLPMTIGFAGMLAVVLGELVSVRLARRVLLPFLVVGAASVLYWTWSESNAAGDLRPYAIVQFLPMLLIPVLLVTHRRNSPMVPVFWLMILFYGLGKIVEFFDAEIFGFGTVISGHSLKHLFAAVAPAILLAGSGKHHGVAIGELDNP